MCDVRNAAGSRLVETFGVEIKIGGNGKTTTSICSGWREANQTVGRRLFYWGKWCSEVSLSLWKWLVWIKDICKIIYWIKVKYPYLNFDSINWIAKRFKIIEFVFLEMFWKVKEKILKLMRNLSNSRSGPLFTQGTQKSKAMYFANSPHRVMKETMFGWLNLSSPRCHQTKTFFLNGIFWTFARSQKCI